jgi:hypothetical protein
MRKKILATVLGILILFSAQNCFAEGQILCLTKGRFLEARAEMPPTKEFVAQLDTLYCLVAKELGLPEKNIGLIVNIYREKKEVPRIESFAIYFRGDENAIYVSLEDLTDGRVAHEMAHALVFSSLQGRGTPQIQEILAKYVEYRIIKIGQEIQRGKK